MTLWNSLYYLTCDDDDAILTDAACTTYKCLSWVGGQITDPLDPASGLAFPSDYFVTGDDLQSMDNYLGNKDINGDDAYRYVGAISYTRDGADSSNGDIALWGGTSHGSIRKPGNNHPHGYDWESNLDI